MKKKLLSLLLLQIVFDYLNVQAAEAFPQEEQTDIVTFKCNNGARVTTQRSNAMQLETISDMFEIFENTQEPLPLSPIAKNQLEDLLALTQEPTRERFKNKLSSYSLEQVMSICSAAEFLDLQPLKNTNQDTTRQEDEFDRFKAIKNNLVFRIKTVPVSVSPAQYYQNIKNLLTKYKLTGPTLYGALANTTSINNPQVIHTIQNEKLIRSASFSPCGTFILTASDDQTAKIINIETKELIHTIQHDDWVTSASFSPCGLFVVTGSKNGAVRVINIQTKELIHTMKHDNWVTSASFSPCGSFVVTTSKYGTAKIINIQTKELIHTIGHNEEATSASFSPCGRYVATASKNHAAKIVNIQTKELIHTIHHQRDVNSVSFSPCGTFVVTASDDKTAKIVNIQTKKLIHIIDLQSWAISASFSPCSGFIVTTSSDKSTKITMLDFAHKKNALNTLDYIFHRGQMEDQRDQKEKVKRANFDPARTNPRSL